MNEIWRIKAPPRFDFWKLVAERAKSFAFILVISFLLLISFIITAAIAALNDYFKSLITETAIYLSYMVDISSSIAIITVMFALMFKFLPDAKIKWRAVWFGAFITAVLFVICKFYWDFILAKPPQALPMELQVLLYSYSFGSPTPA